MLPNSEQNTTLTTEEKMDALKLMVPTYNGRWLDGSEIELADFDEPSVPVLVHQADGVRVVLGTHDHDYEKPDIQIERRHNGWMIFLHPLGCSDASGYVVFLDDGRSFISKENGYGPTEPIEMVEHDDAIAELDDILPTGLTCAPSMVIEKAPIERDEDCPQCGLINGPPVPPLPIAHLPISRELLDAFKSAQEALAGDSNDDEHDALLALVETLEQCKLGDYQ